MEISIEYAYFSSSNTGHRQRKQSIAGGERTGNHASIPMERKKIIVLYSL